MDVKVLNGQSYEAKLQIQHCPNNIGCRALVKQTNGNIIFQLIENVILSLKVLRHLFKNIKFINI